MTIPNGTNLVAGNRLSFQQINRMKNGFRIAAPLGGGVNDAQPGQALSDANDNRRYHIVSVGGSTEAFEILQAECVVVLENEIVCFNNEVVTAPNI